MINWKQHSTSRSGIFICPNCQGRGTIYDKWRKKIICPSCRSDKYLKECPKCKSMMQIEEEDNQCLNCILQLNNLEVTT